VLREETVTVQFVTTNCICTAVGFVVDKTVPQILMVQSFDMVMLQ
jgi:hypothetical protein